MRIGGSQVTTSNDDDVADGNRNTGRHGRWDPFKTFRRVLSPEERMQLLMVKRPVQPPEDFMNTVELKLLKSTQWRDQLRHLSPAIIGLGTLFVALLAAVVWWSPWSSAPITPAPDSALESDVHAASADAPGSPSSPARSAASSELTEPSVASPSPDPAPRGSPTHGVSSPQPAAVAVSARAPSKAPLQATSAVPPHPAPKAQPRPPEDLDLDTPMAPPVH